MGRDGDVEDNPSFTFQLRMLEKGLDQVQREISRLDDILFKIKTGAVTLWGVLIGWALSSKALLLVPLGFVVIIGFWLLESMFRGAQIRYLAKSQELTEFVRNHQVVADMFARREVPTHLIYPVGLRSSKLETARLLLRGLLTPTVATLYLFLGFSTVLVWMAVEILWKQP